MKVLLKYTLLLAFAFALIGCVIPKYYTELGEKCEIDTGLLYSVCKSNCDTRFEGFRTVNSPTEEDESPLHGYSDSTQSRGYDKCIDRCDSERLTAIKDCDAKDKESEVSISGGVGGIRF